MCAMSVCISNFLFLLSSNSPPFPPPILRNAAVTIDLVFREANEQQKCFDWSGNAMPVRAGFSWRGNRFAMKNATQLTVEDGVKVSVYKNRQMDRALHCFRVTLSEGTLIDGCRNGNSFLSTNHRIIDRASSFSRIVHRGKNNLYLSILESLFHPKFNKIPLIIIRTDRVFF